MLATWIFVNKYYMLVIFFACWKRLHFRDIWLNMHSNFRLIVRFRKLIVHSHLMPNCMNCRESVTWFLVQDALIVKNYFSYISYNKLLPPFSSFFTLFITIKLPITIGIQVVKSPSNWSLIIKAPKYLLLVILWNLSLTFANSTFGNTTKCLS